MIKSLPPTTMRRTRESPALHSLPAPDAALDGLVQSLNASASDQGSLLHALHQLCTLTAWQEQNQRHALQQGAVPLLLLLLKANGPRCGLRTTAAAANTATTNTSKRTASPAPADAAEQDVPTLLVVKALTLLCNLSVNEDLSDQVASIPACIQTLVTLMASSAAGVTAGKQQVSVMAARCLINLTQFSETGQREAVKAGLLSHAVTLLMSSERELALAKLGCWLLSNMTTPLGSPARNQLLQQPAALARLVNLAKLGQPDPVVVLACKVIGSLVRETTPQGVSAGGRDALTKMGTLEVLCAQVQAPDCSSQVQAAAAYALSCLAMGHRPIAASLAAKPGFASALGLALEKRADPWAADYDSAQAVLAVHTLLHVLSHVLCNAHAPDGASNGGGSGNLAGHQQVISLDGPDTDLVDGVTRVTVSSVAGAAQDSSNSSKSSQTAAAKGAAAPAASPPGQTEAIYISLAAAARSLGVVLPAALSGAQKDGSSALSPIQAAELRYRVSHVLLPRLRSPNCHTAATAAASLYHLAAACGGAAASEVRCLMADTSLVMELLHKLSSKNPTLTQACLAVLDVLSGEPQCGEVMLRAGWLAGILPHLESGDAVVQRWADRALCSLYMTANRQ